MSGFAFGQLTLLALAVLLAGTTPQAHGEEGCTLERGPARAVVRVVDAETIALDDGSEVRLVGALAPRAPDAGVDASFWPPEREAIAALSDLVLGRSVTLASAGRRTDRYGRQLAHAFVLRDGDETWVQGHLLAHGHARAYGLPGSLACMAELLAHERVAREASVGLWSNAAYAVRSATRTRELMRFRNTYQVVAGRVAKVATVKGRVYLNFGSDWREDFTAGLATAALREYQQWIAGLAALEGKRVRIRGWIERRNGPYVEIHHPAQVEVLEDADEPEVSGGDQGPAAPHVKRRPAQSRPGALDL